MTEYTNFKEFIRSLILFLEVNCLLVKILVPFSYSGFDGWAARKLNQCTKFGAWVSVNITKS